MSTPMKPCLECLATLPLENFHINARKKDGHEGKCKICRNKQKALWKKNNPGKTSLYKKLGQYGLTIAEYKKMVEYQQNKCVICQQSCKQFPTLSIDHNHVTGKVRGLLCSRCNSGLGFFGDDINLLERAIAYIQAHP